MALKIKWKKNGKKIDAYLKVLSINVRRQAGGSNDFGRSGVSTPISNSGVQKEKDFHFDVSYAIYENLGDETPLSRGNYICKYDLNEENIFKTVYRSIKQNKPDIGKPVDV